MLRALRRLSGTARVLSAESATQNNTAIANKQQLYMIDPLTPGSVFFLPHGARIFNKLVQFMKHQQIRYGFQEVITPLIYKKKLYEILGHWDNYKEDMFKVVGQKQALETHACSTHTQQEAEPLILDEDSDAEEYGLKPMNCPGHCLIFSRFERSYNELPVRLSDFSALHRNESSGALSGLTRVRRFHQDDGHIFCEMLQIQLEISNTLKLLRDTYAVFGLTDVLYYLSTRPEKYIGDKATWDHAEKQLAEALHGNWAVREGDGAFYGPKIDVLLKDAFGKQHQVGTVQLDFQLPDRFALQYTAADGCRETRPIMVHRAVFGSLERFLAILLDHYQGKWPFWLNPRQAVIVPVAERHHALADKIRQQLAGDIEGAELVVEDVAPLTGHHFHVDVDKRSETVGLRVKDAVAKGYSYIVMIGDRDTDGLVLVRTRDDRRARSMPVEELYEVFVQHEKKYE